MSGALALLIETNAVLVDSYHIDNDIEYDDAPHDNTNVQPSFARKGYNDWITDSPPESPPPSPSHLLLVNGPTRRNYRDFPIIRAIEHLSKVGAVGYDYYTQRPQGDRTAETSWKWSLYRNDWYYVVTAGNTLVLVGRSILKEMGIGEEDLPVPKDQGLEEVQALPNNPIRWQDFHQLEGHSKEVCHWPEMTENPKYIPVLDRPLGESLVDSLMVHDPHNGTHLHPPSHFPQSDSDSDDALDYDDDEYIFDGVSYVRRPPSMLSQSAAAADIQEDLLRQREEDYTIKYVRVDPNTIGIPWVSPPPKRHQLIGHLHLSSQEQAGEGHSAVVWDAKLDLPYTAVNSLFRRCYQSCPEVYKEEQGECDSTHQPVEADFTGNPEEPGHRRDGLPTRFRVMAKIAAMGNEFHNFVNTEAKAYSRMPKTFSEQWSGYQLVPPVHLPQPAAAIVPITFGYYVPEVRYGRLSNGQRIYMSDHRRLSPLLLMENCGTEIGPGMDELHVEYKEQIYTMMERLHAGGFTQGSVHQRNWLVQPGPLNVAPVKRSVMRPSFRMIDFGRAACEQDVSEVDFKSKVNEENSRIRELLDYECHDHCPK